MWEFRKSIHRNKDAKDVWDYPEHFMLVFPKSISYATDITDPRNPTVDDVIKATLKDITVYLPGPSNPHDHPAPVREESKIVMLGVDPHPERLYLHEYYVTFVMTSGRMFSYSGQTTANSQVSECKSFHTEPDTVLYVNPARITLYEPKYSKMKYVVGES